MNSTVRFSTSWSILWTCSAITARCFFFHNSRCCLERTLTKNVTLTLGAASICITIYIIIIHIYIYRASGRRREGGGSPQGGYIHAMPGHATVSQNHTETEEMVIPSRKLTLFWPISLGSCWILGMHKILVSTDTASADAAQSRMALPKHRPRNHGWICQLRGTRSRVHIQWFGVHIHLIWQYVSAICSPESWEM